jgi:vanillate O-demethylase monooxygenase subunit
MDERPERDFYNLNIDAGAVWARRLIDRLVALEQPARSVVPIRALT